MTRKQSFFLKILTCRFVLVQHAPQNWNILHWNKIVRRPLFIPRLLGHGKRLQELPPTTENTAGCLSGTCATARIATVTRHKFPSCFRQIDPLVATEVWPCSLWPTKKPWESADVEIVFQTAGSGFPGPLGASSGAAGLQEGSPFYCATHFVLHLA